MDPVADIAVLGSLDNQLFDESFEFEEWTESLPALRISDARSGRGWVLSLKGHWLRTRLELVRYGGLSIDPTEPQILIIFRRVNLLGRPRLDWF